MLGSVRCAQNIVPFSSFHDVIGLVHHRVEDVHLDLRNVSRSKSFHDSKKRLELDSVRVWMRPADPSVCECGYSCVSKLIMFSSLLYCDLRVNGIVSDILRTYSCEKKMMWASIGRSFHLTSSSLLNNS